MINAVSPDMQYLMNWDEHDRWEDVNTIYLLSKNPIINVIGNTANNDAICGLKTNHCKSMFCL